MYVFVYGTLKRGFGNSGLLSNSEFIQEAITPPEYTMRSLGFFPGVQLTGKTCIHGEIFRVSDEEMLRLDRLEGYPSFYNRKQINLEGTNIQPWMYYLPENDYNTNDEVPSGVWG